MSILLALAQAVCKLFRICNPITLDERQSLALSNDISYMNTAQRLHIEFTYYFFTTRDNKNTKKMARNRLRLFFHLTALPSLIPNVPYSPQYVSCQIKCQLITSSTSTKQQKNDSLPSLRYYRPSVSTILSSRSALSRHENFILAI